MRGIAPYRGAFVALAAAAAFIAAGPAAAQADCARQSDADRARCELERRAAEACAERKGEDLAACRRSILSPPARQDCSALPEGYGRNKCEDRNLKLDIEERCGGRSPEDYSRCYAEVMAKAWKR